VQGLKEKGRNHRGIFHPIAQTTPQSGRAKIGKVGGMDEVIKRVKCGVYWSISAGSAGSWKYPFPFKRYMTYINLPSTTVQVRDVVSTVRQNKWGKLQSDESFRLMYNTANKFISGERPTISYLQCNGRAHRRIWRSVVHLMSFSHRPRLTDILNSHRSRVRYAHSSLHTVTAC
jgi:hypothetical protein